MGNNRQSSISRHVALAPFSRDHYVGLTQARHLIRASEGGAQERRRIITEFMVAWQQEILIHFQDEERLLISLMSNADQQRMLVEHRQITDLATALMAQQNDVSPDADLMAETGTLLKKHIRWEEREAFRHIQEQVTQDTLEKLHISTIEVEASRDRKKSASGL